MQNYFIKKQNHIVLQEDAYKENKETLTALYNQYYPHIKRYIVSRVDFLEEAEDLSQEVFVELCRSDNHKNQRNIRKYLFGLAKNTVRRHRRKKINSINAIPLDSVKGIAVSYDNQENLLRDLPPEEVKKVIKKITAQLPPKAKEAIRLRLLNGFNSKQAAKKTECSVNAFYKRVHIAIKTLEKQRENDTHHAYYTSQK